MKLETFENGLTVRELKQLIKDWPEVDENGDDCEVWIETGVNLSGPVVAVWPLNVRTKTDGSESGDIMFEASTRPYHK